VNLDQVEKIAEAVLYEGYMLYPYRPSSVKNQQRWNFGVLYPPAYCALQAGVEPSSMQTECLLKAQSPSRLTVKVRFLQIVQRSVGRLRGTATEASEVAEQDIELVHRLVVAGRAYQPWQEAVEQVICCEEVDLAATASRPFTFPEDRSVEYLRDERGVIAGVLVRERKAINGSLEIRSKQCLDDIAKVTVQVQNLTRWDPDKRSDTAARDAILLQSLVSAHTLLGTESGEFLSLLEPPAGFEDLVAQCQNIGTWPVLATDAADAVLSSPIILYDHPQIAPESAGNLFDSTEIDEILSLRILTLTEEEKREMRQSDDRTRGILERTENMPEEQFMKLHGVLRGLTAVKEEMR
jgi:hydrogenase maturation protease